MLRIAHRGASGYEPENTLAAFKKALDFHVDMIELDVRICKTGELVVIHDNTVDRTTNGKGKVRDLTLHQIQKFDAGKGQKIPTLEEVLSLVKTKAKLNINVKDKSALEPTLAAIQEHKKREDIAPDELVISAEKLNILRTAYKTQTVTIVPSLYIFPRLFLRFFQKKNPFAIEVYKRVLSKNLVDIAHAFGIQVYVWTVNEPEEIETFKKMKVDGIISDYPDRI